MAEPKNLLLSCFVGLSLLSLSACSWAQPLARLESPSPLSFTESGVGLIRGWACDARRVEISINDRARQAVAHGTRRADTLEVCGHPDTGFGLTFNWNALGEGVHRLRAFADDVEFADVNFAVATLGADFLTGLNRKYTLGDFPDAGETTEVRWSEPHQNFVISRSTASPASTARPLVLALINSPENWFTGIFAEWNADMTGDEGAGPAVTKDSMGQPTQFHALTWTAAKGSTGVELLLADNGLPVTYRDGSGIEGRLSGFTENSVTVDFYRHGQPVAEPVTTPIDSGLLQNLQAFINRWQSQSAVHQSDAPHNWMERSPSRILLLVNLLFVSAVVNAETNCAVQNAADRAGLLGQISARLACLSPLNQRLLGLHQNRGLANSQFGYADFVVQQTPSVGQEISIDGPACDPSDSYTACLAKTISTAQEELDQRRSRSSNKSNKLSPLVSVLDELVIHQFDPTLTD